MGNPFRRKNKRFYSVSRPRNLRRSNPPERNSNSKREWFPGVALIAWKTGSGPENHEDRRIFHMSVNLTGFKSPEKALVVQQIVVEAIKTKDLKAAVTKQSRLLTAEESAV